MRTVKKNNKKQKRNRIKIILIIILAVILVKYIAVEKEQFVLSNNIPNTVENKVLYKKVAKLYRKYPEVTKVLNRFNDYPEEVTKLLVKEPESIEFALNYFERPKAKKRPLAGLDTSTIPELYQWDTRWGYQKYGDNVLGLTGCGPTVVSMAAIYLKDNTKYSPDFIAKAAQKGGYYVNGVGTSWPFFTNAFKKINLQSRIISLNHNQLNKKLNSGSLIIISVGPGDFTQTGHIMLIAGVDKHGKYIIHDPNSKRNTKTKWDYETLEPQIMNLWEVSK